MAFVKSARGAGLWLALMLAGVVPALGQTGFQSMADDAYSAYRVALFQTNANDQKATLDALAAAQGGWSKVVSTYRDKPPAIYADDRAYAKDLDEVSGLLSRAQAQAAAGTLPAAHETLEGVRDILGELRRRNGVIVFSDHINAYHTEMERVIGGEIAMEDRRALIEQSGVLVYLDRKIRANAPAAYQGDPKFQQLSAGNTAAIEKLRTALASNAVADIKSAIESLKPAYAKLFLAFG